MNKESENKQVTTKSRSALIDLTNSPIVGLASGNLETPSSAKGRECCTPGSGEAILRCQVKNLLQMVEEEAEISLEKRQPLFHVKGVVNSPMSLLIAPANTPLMDLSGNELLPPVTASPVQDNFVISQVYTKYQFSEEFSFYTLIDNVKGNYKDLSIILVSFYTIFLGV